MRSSKPGKRRLAGVVLALLAIASFGACSGGDSTDTTATTGASSASSSFPVTVVDAAGKTHTYDSPVTRIGCNWVGCLEALADLGVQVRAASIDGIEGSKLFLPLGNPKFDLDKMGGADSAESWAQTDIQVIGDRGPEDPSLKALAKVADMFYLWAPGYDTDAKFTGPEAYEENLRLLGKITGRSDQAEAAIKEYQSFATALKAKAPAGAAATTVSALFATTDGTYNTLPVTSAFCVALQENAMGRCATSAKFNSSTWQMNPEAYLAMNPDWIAYTGSIDYDAADATAKTTWKSRHDPVWEKLSAVQQGHVYDAPDQMHCCGLRSLQYHLQDYAFHVWGPSSGVTAPGILNDFDPAESTVLTKP